MLRLLNNLLPILLCAIFSISCEFIDLRPINFSIEPEETDSVLPEIYSPVIIKFNTEMKKRETEGILQIISNLGITSGEKSWIGNTLYFTPEAGWTAGICYYLNFSGTIHSADGRETRTEKYYSFYAINKNIPPLLESFSPLNGASAGTNNFAIEFYFSKPMDRLSVEFALTIDGIGNKTYEWTDNDKKLKIKTDKNLTPWIYYRWNLKDSAKSDDGVPLAKAYSGHFITDLDQILPEITSIYPVIFSDGSWYPTGAGIENGLGSGQGIAVSFNKSMEENVLRSLRFDPSLSGRVEFLSEKSIVYIFAKDPEPEINYTFIVSGDAKDCEGLKIGSEFRINFSVDIPFFNLLSFSVNDITIENFSDQNIIPVKITQGTDELLVNIRFSLPFNIREKQNTPQKITLTPIFPKTLSPVALQYIKWISDDCLLLRWEGMTNGKKEIPNYYKIIIPGGKNGIVLENGSYLKEDIVLFLEAEE